MINTPTEPSLGKAQWRKSGCIRVDSCCLPVLAFEPAHIGVGLDRRFSARMR
jgi:hypothetical protein